MLYATNRFPGDGMTTQYEISFVGGYLDRTHVKAYIEGADLVQTPITLSSGNFLGPYTIGGIPTVPVGSTLVIYRDTPKSPIVDFVNGSRFTESNLDTATRQGSFIAAEGADAVSPAGLAGVIQQVADFSASAGVARDQAVAAKNTAVASYDAASLSASNANDSAISAATDAALALNNKNLSDTAAFNAATSASEALGYRNTAGTHATNAGNSATAAAASATTATNKASEANTSAQNAATSAAQAASSAASINPNDLVHLSGVETITGAKTFTGTTVVPTVANPSATPTVAVNFNSARGGLVLNAWPTVSGVTNNVVYIGWHGADGRLIAQVDGSSLGSVVTSVVAHSGKIGALAFAHFNTQGVARGYGDIAGGDELRPASPGSHQGTTPFLGVWTCLGYCVGSTDPTSPSAKTMWLRTS
jgi:hypothetical protein